MSLKVWLPLNGDLKNIGSSNVIVTNNGATVDNSGKIGKCYNFNGSNYLTLSTSLLNDFGNEISACAWVNISAWNSQYDSIVKMYAGDNAWKNSIFAMGRNNTTSRLYFSIANGTSSTQASCVLPTDQSLNTWYHVACVYNNTEKNIKIYLNGDLAVTYNTTIVPNLASVTSIGIGGSPLASYGLKGKLNDVRIYDHCLSALEVKEISQALILHYKLNDANNSTNLILNGFGELGGNIGWINANVSTTELPPNSTAKASFYNGNMTSEYIPIISNHSYTLSCKLKSSGATSGSTYPSIYPYDIDKNLISNLQTTVGFNMNSATTLAQPLNPGDTKIYATDLSNWIVSSGNYYNYCAIFGYKDSTGYIYPDLVYTRNTPAYGSSTNAKTNIDKQNNIITLNSAYNGPQIPAGRTICQSTAGSTYWYPFGRLALANYQDWTEKTVTFIPKNDGRLVAAAYIRWSTYGNLYIAENKLVDNTWNSNYIADSSGYENNGIIVGNVKGNNSSIRYDNSLHLIKGESSYINSNNKFLFLNENPFTISFWVNCNDWTTISNDTAAFLMNNWGSATTGGFRIYSSANTNRYRMYWVDTTSTNKSIYFSVANKFTSGWHMLTATFDGSTMKTYCDGVYYTQLANTSFKSLTSPNLYVGNGTSSVTGDYADFRLYATALSAEDILKLYQTPTEIDKNGSWHTHEFYENGENFITKTGLIKDSASSEYPFTQHLKYDPEIYFEPDGSAWVHIYHHNNPGAGSFASSNTFANSCYIDGNRWFNATEICNQLNKWEFLIKYAFTSGSVEYKERWIQTKNPENAVFADVDAADITRITGNGYKTGTWGGLYKKNSGAYWVMNNGNSGNWWGATGSFSVYQSGIPGYGGTVTTTGYNDLYVRIDNIDFDQIDKAWITKSNIYLGNSLIER